MESSHRSRDAAVRAACRTAEKLLLANHEVCLKLYQSLGVITLFDVQGRGRKVLHRFTWGRA